ncbi:MULTISPECIES: response regulator [unclassified Microbacterium]|uniref:response regulator n=1 Tax=unclassified Microbacterium TaxID=2609290 RepID=UPI000F551867|nr:response regulator [Microbacterium sp. ABRD28]AZC14425.1 response regulator [Microbacterium sp. ABRD28]
MISSPELVARIRAASGDTQEGLARRLGVSFPTINAWERGRSEPTPRHRSSLEQLASDLGVVHDFVVMVIDDDPVTAELVRAAAADVDPAVTVESASNGWEGLVRCGAVRPHLLFLDIMMPGIDGMEVARRLPSVEGLDDLRIIFVTASQSADVLRRAGELGAGVLSKPVDIDELAAMIRTVMDEATVR